MCYYDDLECDYKREEELLKQKQDAKETFWAIVATIFVLLYMMSS